MNPAIGFGMAAGWLLGTKTVVDAHPGGVPGGVLAAGMAWGLVLGYAATLGVLYLVRLVYVRVKAGSWVP